MTQGRIIQLFESGHITAREAADWWFQERWLVHYKGWCRRWKYLAIAGCVLMNVLLWIARP